MIDEKYLKRDEKAIFGLRELFLSYGYSQFRMSKFEEYDLYVKNKDFLVSEGIITFNDTNGRLLALKPDVTLSIVKNASDEKNLVQKVFYNENVYRLDKNTSSYKEIMQTGLECIGDITTLDIVEVITLSAKSLESISDKFVLEISDMSFLSAIFEDMKVDGDIIKLLSNCIKEKNGHEIEKICNENAISSKYIDILMKTVSVFGEYNSTIDQFLSLELPAKAIESLKQLKSVIDLVDKKYSQNINIDFSVINDMRYYSGIVFKGFIEGIPTDVLSGGRYDNLIRRMKRSSSAIGFAVYLDLLEHLYKNTKPYDFDILLCFDKNEDERNVNIIAESLREKGNSVMTTRNVPKNTRFSKILKVVNGKLEEVTL